MTLTFKNDSSGDIIENLEISNLVIEEIQYNEENCDLIKFKLDDKTLADHKASGDGKLIIKFTSINKEMTQTYELSAHYGGTTTQELNSSEDLYIISFPISNYDRIETNSNNRLRIYLREDFFYQIPEEDVHYEKGTNPFTYLFKQQAYDIIPKPEACSYLETSHNIRTSGIVIGSNIETHSFLLNDLGNNVTILGGEIERIDEAEKQDRKDIDHLNSIIQENKKIGWRDVLDIALEVGSLISMGFTATMFFKMKFAARKTTTGTDPINFVAANPPPANVLGHAEAAINVDVQELTNNAINVGGMAGGPLPAIEIYSDREYRQSLSLVEDIFNRLAPQPQTLMHDPDFQNSNISFNTSDYQYIDFYTFTKPTKFNNLSIFRGVMRIGDFLKTGRITDDDRLDAFISISPKTVFRFYDDDGNDILIDGFTIGWLRSF